MIGLAPLFAAATALLVGIVSICLWSPRRLAVKLGCLALATGFMPIGYAALADLMSKPKPIALEWWNARQDDATVVASSISEGDGIYLWLMLDGIDEPRAYVLPWDRDMAEQLLEAMREAEEQESELAMRLPFERSLDDRKPKFYTLPQPTLPSKDRQGPAKVYEHPGVDA